MDCYKLEAFPLYQKENLTWEEAFLLDRQIRELLLNMDSMGYQVAAYVRAEFAQTGLDFYHALVSEQGQQGED